MRHVRETARWLTVAAVLSGGVLAGCSNAPKAPGAGDKSADAAPFRKLRELAALQERSPVSATMAAPPPDGLELQESAASQSREPLDAALARLASPPAPQPERAAARDAETALHLYITGRQKLMSKDASGAIVDLRKAVELDPGAGEIWRELAEAQAVSGFRSDAQASFERALGAGLEDARVLERLARAATERGDQRAAAALFARAMRCSPEKADPLLPAILEISLAKSFAAEGRFTAARDLLARGLSRSAQIGASTRYGEEFGEIYRRQGDLWRDVGDLSCRLGQFDRALQAYGRAEELPSLDARPLTPRIVYAFLRQGRPAAAALGVLGAAADHGGRIGDEPRELLAYIARHWPGSGAISDAILDLARSATPSVASDIALTRAAVLPPQERARLLRDHLAAYPRDARAVAALIQTAGSASRAVDTAIELTRRNPAIAARAADGLLRSTIDAQQIQDALLAPGRAPERSLLAARYLLMQGWTDRASQLAHQARPQGPAAVEQAVVNVETSIRSGDRLLAEKDLLTLSPLPASRSATARALGWLQRNSEAMDLLRAEIASPVAEPARRIEDLIVASDLAVSLGQGEEAETYLKQATSLDAFDDRAPSRLLSLYATGGPRADPARFNQAVRELRRINPECRTLRGARVKELLRRALLEQAADEALRLADDDPSDGYSIDLLVSVARARAARDGNEALQRVRDWLESQLRRRPASAPLLAGYSAVLAIAGEPETARARVADAIAGGAGPDAARILEHIVRDDLKHAEEADALTLRRLGSRTLLPGEAVELAECQARNSDTAAACRTLIAAFPPPITLTSEQAARALPILSTAAQKSIGTANPEAREACAAAFDLLAARRIPMPPDAHERRLQVLALIPTADADRLLDAAAYTAAQYPNLGAAPYIRASIALDQAKRPTTALVLIAKAAQTLKDPPLDLFVEWTRIIAAAGTPAHVKVMIERAEAVNRLRELVDRYEGPAETPARNLRAEAAYFLGNLFAAAKRTDQADAAYELALTYDPQHAWSLNNLGYSLLERGGDVGRASELLERAHASLPSEASITDSLGWLRYKQALIDDERDANGVIAKRGAVSLLQEAAMTDRGRSDPTILNHLADALWVAGRAEEARRYWQLSEQLVARLLAPKPSPGGEGETTLSPATIEEYRLIKDNASAKRRAAASGQTVRVAPQLNNPNPQPPASDGPAAPANEPAKPAQP